MMNCCLCTQLFFATIIPLFLIIDPGSNSFNNVQIYWLFLASVGARSISSTMLFHLWVALFEILVFHAIVEFFGRPMTSVWWFICKFSLSMANKNTERDRYKATI